MDGLSDLDPDDNDEYQTDTDSMSDSEANDTSEDNISNREVSASYQ
jgi:hypothetical protein